MSIVELLLQNKRQMLTNFDDRLALGLAALMFSGGLVYLYIDKFNPYKFCLMNNNDPFCNGYNETSCFTQHSSSVFADHFGFGGFIEIGSGFGFILLKHLKYDYFYSIFLIIKPILRQPFTVHNITSDPLLHY